jgi:hypothetical protein
VPIYFPRPPNTRNGSLFRLNAPIKRLALAGWILLIAGFALVHFLHLGADFPNHTEWYSDWAKYTDEGWYGNAAIRAHLFGNWYMPGDFNPAPAVPVWPFLEWVLFFFTGVSVVAVRALVVSVFVVNLALSYLLLRGRGSRWTAMLALTLIVTSPFLYAFSRLAILEPLLTTFFLAALNLAVRLPRLKRPMAAAAAIGLFFTLMLLTKTSAVFLLPGLVWAMLAAFASASAESATPETRSTGKLWPPSIWPPSREAVRAVLAAAVASAVSFGLWIGFIASRGLLGDFHYLFSVNKWEKPKEFYWPAVSFWWSFHGGLWIDHILVPLAGIVFLLALVYWLPPLRAEWARKLLADPVFGASLLSAAGFILFMTYQNHPQPRYFTVVALFTIFVLAQGASALVESRSLIEAGAPQKAGTQWERRLGAAAVAVAVIGAASNAATTLTYAAHPEYTWVNAARNLTRYIDAHPNGKRLLVSISGDDITLITHLPTLCDDFGTEDLADKLGAYQPGWWATWNSVDAGTLEDLHTHFSLEQVGSWPAFDDPDRNVLILFKLHPLPGGKVREAVGKTLRVKLPGDKFTATVDEDDDE